MDFPVEFSCSGGTGTPTESWTAACEHSGPEAGFQLGTKSFTENTANWDGEQHGENRAVTYSRCLLQMEL